jgi:cytochrome c peroxidase
MFKKSYSIIVIAVATLLYVFFNAGFAQQLLPPTMFNTKIIEVDGVRVPDIGPLPTTVPIPATNLNYKTKVKLGEQLYFDGRLSQNGAISCAFCLCRPQTSFRWRRG